MGDFYQIIFQLSLKFDCWVLFPKALSIQRKYINTHPTLKMYPLMIEERQRAKPRARATWLVMQLQFWGSPRKTMEQRKVTTSDKSSVKLNRASLAFTRGVPIFTINTTWSKKGGMVGKSEFCTLHALHLDLCVPCTSLTPIAMVTRAPKAEMTMRVIPRGSPKARNSMIFGTQASCASLDQSSSLHRIHSRASVREGGGGRIRFILNHLDQRSL